MHIPYINSAECFTSPSHHEWALVSSSTASNPNYLLLLLLSFELFFNATFDSAAERMSRTEAKVQEGSISVWL
ncbi:unnamed protein product [Orchesella dallaii]|uniref:Uncharacterized protein n=1 Tax=Orchesella dallaii TaxID=48710 RepID=A0ABP1PLY3_9HEXA